MPHHLCQEFNCQQRYRSRQMQKSTLFLHGLHLLSALHFPLR